jgi:hypothetical protein
MSELTQVTQDGSLPSAASQPAPSAIAALPDLAMKLDRVLEVIKEQQRQGALELVLVIVLAMTALGSTWCAYQSQLWNGVQIVRLSDAEIASQEARGNTLAALQRRTMDGLAVLHFMDALQRSDVKAVEAIRRRMPSPLREATEACLALDPLNNPEAPGPLRMPQYELVEEQDAERAHARAVELRGRAQQAGNNGDTYVLLTLLFASVLFFGGITGTFQSRRLRVGLAGIACLMFLATVGSLATMPVCRG